MTAISTSPEKGLPVTRVTAFRREGDEGAGVILSDLP